VSVGKDLHQPSQWAVGSERVPLWQRAVPEARQAPTPALLRGTDTSRARHGVGAEAVRTPMLRWSVAREGTGDIQPLGARRLLHVHFSVFSTEESRSHFAIGHHRVTNRRALLIMRGETEPKAARNFSCRGDYFFYLRGQRDA